MESLVADLLFLARAEDAALPEPRLLDLDDVVREEVERLRPSSGIAVHADVTAAPVRGRREDLARMVRNLLANATGHAATRVDLSLVPDGDRVVLAVQDDGPGVAAEHRDRIFDRFYRVDAGAGPGPPRHRARPRDRPVGRRGARRVGPAGGGLPLRGPAPLRLKTPPFGPVRHGVRAG